MKKYVKKPVEIEALQWTGDNHREMFDFLEGKPDQHMTAFGNNFRIDHSKVEGGLVIKTLEGEHIASIGDFIIKGIKGEFYPCKPDVFELTYQESSKNHPTLPSDEVTAEGILKSAIGEIRFSLNGSITNGQIIYAMEQYASARIAEMERSDRFTQGYMCAMAAMMHKTGESTPLTETVSENFTTIS